MKKHSFVCICIWLSFFMLQKDKECSVKKIKAKKMVRNSKNMGQREKKKEKRKTTRKEKVG